MNQHCFRKNPNMNRERADRSLFLPADIDQDQEGPAPDQISRSRPGDQVLTSTGEYRPGSAGTGPAFRSVKNYTSRDQKTIRQQCRFVFRSVKNYTSLDPLIKPGSGGQQAGPELDQEAGIYSLTADTDQGQQARSWTEPASARA